MWKTYRNEIIIGLIVGLLIIVLGFVISSSWVLRLLLISAILVGEGVYFIRVLGVITPSTARSYEAPMSMPPAQTKKEKSPSRRASGNAYPPLQQHDTLGSSSEDRKRQETPVVAPEDSKPLPPKSAVADAKQDETAGPPAGMAPKPQPAPPPAPVPDVADAPEPAAKPQPIIDSMLDESPAEAEPEMEEELVEEIVEPAEPEPASDEDDAFGTGVFDSNRDIDWDAVESYREALGDSSQKDMTVHFSAYYPKEIKPKAWQPLHTYIYRKFVETQILKDAADKLGEKMASFRQGSGTASQIVAEGATIAVTPYLPGFQFNPPVAIIGFYKDWHRLDFEVRAVDAPLNQASNGRITFTVEGVIVGDIPLSIFVGDSVEASTSTHTSQKIYQAIFASYSHSDTQIVERVERAFKALGLDYLRDVTTLRSGQDWNAELLKMIDRADVFQLFWSESAAKSKYVRQEWEYALNLGREKLNFIRPVYWQKPMPDAPDELGHIHFAYQPDLDD